MMLESFEAFMFADSARFRHLVRLHFAPNLVLPSSVQTMKRILSSACWLESLELLSKFDVIASAERLGIFNLTARLPRLRRLKLVLQGTASELDRTILSVFDMSTLEAFEISVRSRSVNVISIIPHNLLSTITTLTLGGISFDDTADKASGATHSNIHTLYIHDTDIQDAEVLVRLFPRVRVLRLRTDCANMHMVHDSEELTILRSANRYGQRESAWEELDVLVGDLPSLFVYALVTPVRTLRIEKDLAVCYHADMLRAVLEDARPTALSLAFSHSDQEEFNPETIQGMIPPMLALDQLSLEVKLRSYGEVADLQTAFVVSQAHAAACYGINSCSTACLGFVARHAR
jgi:hypothetical protein